MIKKYFLFTFIAYICSNSIVFSQSKGLSVADAVNYLENVVNQDIKLQDNIYGGNKRIDIGIFESEITIKYIWENNKDVIAYEYKNLDIDYNEISFDVKNISKVFLKKYDNMFAVALQCKDNTKNCFYENENAIKTNYSHKFVDNPKAVNHYNFLHVFYLNDAVNQKKVYNALTYILYELDKQNKELALIDPFVSGGKKVKREVVDLTKRNGVFTLKVDLGGINQKVMLDSGASDVSLPESFVNKLLEKGIIKKDNFLTPGLYSIADGSVVENRRFIIPYIKVNDITVKNVRCSENKSQDVFLLGKAFLDRFKSWKIDNEIKKLILEL